MVDDCVTLRKNVLSNVEPASTNDSEDGIDLDTVAVDGLDKKSDTDQKEKVILGGKVNILLTEAQMKIVADLKALKVVSYWGICKVFLELGKQLRQKKWRRLLGYVFYIAALLVPPLRTLTLVPSTHCCRLV